MPSPPEKKPRLEDVFKLVISRTSDMSSEDFERSMDALTNFTEGIPEYLETQKSSEAEKEGIDTGATDSVMSNQTFQREGDSVTSPPKPGVSNNEGSENDKNARSIGSTENGSGSENSVNDGIDDEERSNSDSSEDQISPWNNRSDAQKLVMALMWLDFGVDEIKSILAKKTKITAPRTKKINPHTVLSNFLNEEFDITLLKDYCSIAVFKQLSGIHSSPQVSKKCYICTYVITGEANSCESCLSFYHATCADSSVCNSDWCKKP